VHHRDGDTLVAGNSAAPGARAVPGQKGFDVAAFELGERGDVGELAGEELAEEDEVVDQPVHRGA
jgi:hypothetical protein